MLKHSKKRTKYPTLTEKRGEVNFWFWFVLNVPAKKLGRMAYVTKTKSLFRHIAVKYVASDFPKVLKTQQNKKVIVKSA